MPEFTEIKLVWKYEDHRNDPKYGEGSQEWILFADGQDIAKLYKPNAAFMERHKITGPIFVIRNGCQDLLPWRALEAGLDKDELFRLSDSGVAIAEMDDVYEMNMAVRIKRQPDGSIVRVSDWIEQGE